MTRPVQAGTGVGRLLDGLAGLAGYPEIADDIAEGYELRLASTGGVGARIWLARQLGALVLLAVCGTPAWLGRQLAGLRYTLRRLVRRPSLTLPFAIVLGGGLGAVAFMVEVRDALLHPRLGVAEGVRLVVATDSTGSAHAMLHLDPDAPWTEPPPPATGRLFSSRFQSAIAETPAGLLQVTMDAVPEGFVTGLGGALRLGHDLDGPDQVVLAYSFWRSHWPDGTSPLGATLGLDGRRVTVVGVSHPDFDGPTCCVRPSLWVSGERPVGPYRIVVAGVADSTAAASSLATRLHEAGQTTSNIELPHALAAVFGGKDGPVGRALMTLLWLALAALVAGILNGGNLLVADALERRDEVSIRRSIGASPGAIVALVVKQAALLAVAASVIGLLFGRAMTEAAPHLLPIIGPSSTLEIDLGARGLVVLLVGAALGASLCALPAAVIVMTTAARARRRGSRVSGGLVAAQAALGTVLVVLTGMLLVESRRLDGEFVGFRNGSAGIFPVRVSDSDRSVTPDELLSAASATTPGATAALTRSMPVYGAEPDSVSFGSGEPVEVYVEEATDGFFDVLGLRLLDGRPARDRREAVASADLRGAGASLGATLVIEGEELTVVGLAEAATWARGERRPTVYRGWNSERVTGGLLLLHTPDHRAPELAAVAAALTPAGYAASWFGTLREQVVRSRVFMVFLQRLAMLFALLCLLVVVVGVYAHFTRWVKARHRDLGIRHALGARPARLRGVLYVAAAPVLTTGLITGLGTSWYLGRSAARVIGVAAPGFGLLTAGTLIVAASAVASLIGPAFRVVRYEPRRLLTDE